MKVSYNWLKWYIPQIPSPEELADVFTYHICEVEGVEKFGEDTVFDVNILPNRAHDLLSHQGIAREVAYLLGIKFVDPASKYKVPDSESTKLQIQIDTDKCRRYMGRVVRGVKVGPSPEWVKTHLESIGQRPINNIVDAANLVMFDCGQPVHAFDAAKISDEKIIIRSAKEGETMTTLDDKEISFSEKDMVIADKDRVLAIAGVKGGKDSGVDSDTKDIILEVASFDPTSVRKTAQSINLFTDARKRFENDLSPELCSYAMQELSALVLETCPEAVFEDIVDVYPQKQEEKKLSFSAERVSEILGVSVSDTEVEEILKRYNFDFEKKGENFEMKVPLMRLDLENEEDMAEEIGRIIGFDRVKPELPEIDFDPREDGVYKKISWARNKLLEEGYSEVITYSFAQKGKREVLESASDKKFLRTNLSDGLKESISMNQLNAPFLEIETVKVFEIGNVFLKDKEEVRVAYGDKKKIEEVSLDEFCKEMDEGFEIGENKTITEKFKMWSLYPFITRDVAVWVPEDEGPGKLEKLLKKNGTELLMKEPYLFDSFTKEGRTSYAFRLVFQSYDKTLTDEEVNKVMEKVTDKIKENKDWEIR